MPQLTAREFPLHHRQECSEWGLLAGHCAIARGMGPKSFERIEAPINGHGVDFLGASS